MTTESRIRLGVVGGLGPLASADFYLKLTQLTPAATDRDHVPLAMLSLPQTPDRSGAVLGTGPSPFPELQQAVRILDALGAECIVITCNTAHHWFDELAATSRARLLHVADGAIRALRTETLEGKVAVLATRGTLHSGFYQRRLADEGFEPVVPPATLQAEVDRAIALVKASRVDEAGIALGSVLDKLAAAGAGSALLACTELPVALAADRRKPPLATIDVTLELAREALTVLGYLPEAHIAEDPAEQPVAA